MSEPKTDKKEKKEKEKSKERKWPREGNKKE